MSVAAQSAWARYATGSEIAHFADFCRDFLIQSVDEWDGQPLDLEPFQTRALGEALAYDGDGWPVWRSVVFVWPRKQGKTTVLAAYAVYRLLTSDGLPEILLAATSDEQAGRLFDAAAMFVRRNETLSALCRVRDHVGEVVREDGGGKVKRMSSDPGRLHGYNPSLVICDELAQWTTPTLRRAFAALTSGGAARKAPQVFSITTAGEAETRSTSILGRLLDGALAKGELEREPGLTIARLWDAKTLVWNHEAPTTDPRDVAAMKLANPASWVTEEYLARQAANDELTDAEVLQLHGCVWAAGVNAWLTPQAWEGCFDAVAAIPDGATVAVGVDVGLVHDSTAVAAAWVRPDGRVVVEAEAWSAAREAVADHFVAGGVVDLELVEDHIRGLARRFRVAGVFYDPRFFERSAQILDQGGLLVVPLPQSAAPMLDAYESWYRAVLEGQVVHAGGRTLTAHVMAAAAQKTDRGWKVSKIRQTQRIDALVAAVMAHWGALNHAPKPRARAYSW